MKNQNNSTLVHEAKKRANRFALGATIFAVSFAAMLAVQSNAYLSLESKLQDETDNTDYLAQKIEFIEAQLETYVEASKPAISLYSDIILSCLKDGRSICTVYNVAGQGLVVGTKLK